MVTKFWAVKKMQQNEVTAHVKEFLQKRGYKVVPQHKRWRPVDVFALKNLDKWFIEVEAESPKRKMLLQDVIIAVGEIVAEMHEIGPNIHYGIALSESLSTQLA